MVRRQKRIKGNVVIISVTSDIGKIIAQNYLRDGFGVIGTYRSKKHLSERDFLGPCHLFHCDVNDKKSIVQFIQKYKKLNIPWQTFISCVAEPRPLTAFFGTDFDAWENSTRINSVDQLRVIHALYPFRDKTQKSNIVFFAGGGVNKPVFNFSAYTIGKIMLIKMCEYLDAENEDLNIFTVGPGWTRTKTHMLVLRDPHVSEEKRRDILNFLKSKGGTDINYIYECIRWLAKEGKKVAGGRNFSIVYDPLKKSVRDELKAALKKDKNMYKLRRYGSDIQ